jgi:hypothetical protein
MTHEKGAVIKETPVYYFLGSPYGICKLYALEDILEDDLPDPINEARAFTALIIPDFVTPSTTIFLKSAVIPGL